MEPLRSRRARWRPRRPHTAADLPALKRRARCARGHQQALARPEHDLAVGADIDGQCGPIAFGHARDQQDADCVRANKAGNDREGVYAARRIDDKPRLLRRQSHRPTQHRNVRRARQIGGVKAEENRAYRCCRPP